MIDVMEQFNGISELQVVAIRSAAKIVKMDSKVIQNACDVYRQSRGRDGLPCFVVGKFTRIRVGAIKEWLKRLEEKEVA